MRQLTRWAFVILLMPLVRLSAQNAAFLVDYSVDITVDDGQLKREIAYLIRVDDKESNWIGQISIYHSPLQKYKLKEALILDSNKQPVRKIKSSDIHSVSVNTRSSLFDDRMIDKFSAIHNQYPYYIQYAYSITQKEFFHIISWIPHPYTKTSTLKAKLTLKRPKEYQVHIDSIGNFEYTHTETDHVIQESWMIENPKKVTSEAYAPPSYEELEQITIVPAHFNYGTSGSSDTWNKFGQWVYDLNSDLDQLPSQELAAVKSKFGHLTDRRELIRNLYYYLQDNTRYINVSIDIGGLKPYPASYVSANKYGDCKALTIYMKALLNAFGIKSYYTLVESGTTPAVLQSDFPSSQFDHVILSVPMETDTLWLENTADYLPFNYLGSFTQNREALMVQEEGSTIIRTPSLTASETKTRNSYALTLTEEALSGRLTKYAKGEDFKDYAYIKSQWSLKDQKDYFQSYFHKQKTLLHDYTLDQPNRNQSEILLEATLSFPYAFRQIGNTLVVNPPYSEIPDKEDFKNRERPIRLMMPTVIEDSVSIKLTENLRGKASVFKGISIKSEYGTYESDYRLMADEIKISRTFNLYSGNYSAEKGEQLYDFLKSIEAHEANSPIVIQD